MQPVPLSGRRQCRSCAAQGAAWGSLTPIWGAACPFLITVGLGGCDGAMEPAQTCCSALLCAVPRHLQTSYSPSRISKHLSQTSNKQQKVLLWGSLGEGEKLWGATTGSHAKLCLKHCLVEQGQFPASFMLVLLRYGMRVPPFSPLVSSFSGSGALREVQPHSWIQTHQSPLVIVLLFPPPFRLTSHAQWN